jgi:hypothetical protein
MAYSSPPKSVTDLLKISSLPTRYQKDRYSIHRHQQLTLIKCISYPNLTLCFPMTVSDNALPYKLRCCKKISLSLKGKAFAEQAWCGPVGSSRFRLPDLHDIRHKHVVRSSASRTGRVYPQEMFLVLTSLEVESVPGPW